MTDHTGVAHYREVGQLCLTLPGVEKAEVERHHPRHEGTALILRVGPGYGRVPPRVLRMLADHAMGIAAVSELETYHLLLAV